MIPCLNTSTLRECPDYDLPSGIAACAAAGYRALEPWVRELDAWVTNGGEAAEIGRRCRDVDLAIVNLIGFFAWCADDADERAAGLEEARRCFELAAAVGCPAIAAPPVGVKDQEHLDLDAAVERYRALIALGREHGVTPILEFWGPARSLGHLGEALYVVAESGEPEACLLADIYHLYKKGTPHAGLRHLGPDTMRVLHVNDYPADPPRATIADADRVYPGDGIADWAEIRATLSAIGYTGPVSLELFNRSYWQRPCAEVAQTGMSKLRAVGLID